MTKIIRNLPAAQWIGSGEIKRLEDQNNACKQLLAAVLMSGIDQAQLDYFEYYQNRFLEMDEKIHLLKIDLQDFEAPGTYATHQADHMKALPEGLASIIKIHYEEIRKEIGILTTAFQYYLDNRLSR